MAIISAAFTLALMFSSGAFADYYSYPDYWNYYGNGGDGSSFDQGDCSVYGYGQGGACFDIKASTASVQVWDQTAGYNIAAQIQIWGSYSPSYGYTSWNRVLYRRWFCGAYASQSLTMWVDEDGNSYQPQWFAVVVGGAAQNLQYCGGGSGGTSGWIRSKLPTTTTLSASPNPSDLGQPVTFTATVSPTDGGGTVSFSADGSPISGCTSRPLASSGGPYKATCTTSSLSGGTHEISASYSGNAGHGPSTGTLIGGQRVLRPATSTTVTSSRNPSYYGEPVTFSATVTATDGGGTIRFSANGSQMSGCSDKPLVSVGGSYGATCTTSSLAAGTHSITAAYSGNAAYEPSSGSLSGGQTVLKFTTTTTVSSSSTTSTYGQPVTFTATVSPSDGGGTVAFSAGGSAIAGCTAKPLASAGGSFRATCVTSSLAAGNHAISAAYSGNAGYASSSGSLGGMQSVAQASTTTTLSSSGNPSSYGQPVTFKAVVHPSGNGRISFGSGGTTFPGCTSLAPTLVDGSYQATCTVSSLALGTHNVTATYSGDANTGPSAGSITGGQVVQPAATILTADPALLRTSPLRVSVFVLQAKLAVQWSGAGLGGQPLVFRAGTTTLCNSVSTNSSGSATCSGLTASQWEAVVANNGYTVSYAGATSYLSSSASAPLISSTGIPRAGV